MTEKDTKSEARPFGGLSPADAARKAVKAREKKRAQRNDPKQRGEELLKQLVFAALGEGDWKDLAPGLRLQALVKANEYINGRPVPMKPEEKPEESNGRFSVVATQSPSPHPEGQ